MVAPPRVRIRIALAVVAVATVAVGCTPGGSVSLVTAPPKPAVTGVPDTGPITLTIWDQESGQVGKIWDQLNAEFEQTYPERDDQAGQPRLRRAEDAPRSRDVRTQRAGRRRSEPGVARHGSPRQVGAAPAAGQLRRGVRMARPRLAERPAREQLVARRQGVRHGQPLRLHDDGRARRRLLQQAVLADLGLTVPTTFNDFEQDLAVAKQAGQVPIPFGNNDAFPGIHEYAVIQDQTAPTSYLTDLIFGTQTRGALVRHTGEHRRSDDPAELGERRLLLTGVRRRRLRRLRRRTSRRVRACS